MSSEPFIGQLATKARLEKVDTTDRKIVYLLSLNARRSNTALARHLNLSREIVSYRIKRLQDADILHGFLTLINAQKIGKSVQSMGIKLHTTVKTEDVITNLKQIPSITKITHCGGMYDLLLTIMGDNVHTNYDTLQHLLTRHGQQIRQYHLFPKLEQEFLGLKMLVEDRKERAFLEKIYERKGSAFQAEFSKNKKNHDTVQIDSVDSHILNCLKHDARIPLRDLSAKIGIGIFQLKTRIVRLIREGVIQGFIPYLSLAQLGLQFNIVFLNVKKDSEQKFHTWVEQHHSIVWKTKFLGSHNYKLSLFVHNNAHLSDILNELCTEFGENVSQIESLPVFKSPLYHSYFRGV